jgi:hypothetical protein
VEHSQRARIRAGDAAIYRAAALIPGVVEVPDSVDASGRHGVAVARVDPTDGVRTEWIFDKKTLSYLGEREVQVTDTKEIKPGTVLGYTAVITRAVVDQAGRTSWPSDDAQRPVAATPLR